MKPSFSKFHSILVILSLLLSCTIGSKKASEAPAKDDDPKHRDKHHPNAQPLSFWESREIFMKGHDKSEAKFYIVLIAIFSIILILVLVCIGLICWKESVKDREEEENSQLQHQMMVYENDNIVSGQDKQDAGQKVQDPGSGIGGGGSTVGKEGGQFSYRSFKSNLSPRERSSSFVKTNLQEGYINSKPLNPMTMKEPREQSPKSKSSTSQEFGESRRPSFLKMWGTSTEMTSVKHQESLDPNEGGLSSHGISKASNPSSQNIFGNSGVPEAAKQRQTSHFGVIKEQDEENSYNNSEAQSKKLRQTKYQSLPQEEQRTGVDLDIGDLIET